VDLLAVHVVVGNKTKAAIIIINNLDDIFFSTFYCPFVVAASNKNTIFEQC